MNRSGEDAYARMRACAMQRESAEAYRDAREATDGGFPLAVGWQKLAARASSLSRMETNDWMRL